MSGGLSRGLEHLHLLPWIDYLQIIVTCRNSAVEAEKWNSFYPTGPTLCLLQKLLSVERVGVYGVMLAWLWSKKGCAWPSVETKCLKSFLLHAVTLQHPRCSLTTTMGVSRRLDGELWKCVLWNHERSVDRISRENFSKRVSFWVFPL